jgi:hypothetical protein
VGWVWASDRPINSTRLIEQNRVSNPTNRVVGLPYVSFAQLDGHSIHEYE